MPLQERALKIIKLLNTTGKAMRTREIQATFDTGCVNKALIYAVKNGYVDKSVIGKFMVYRVNASGVEFMNTKEEVSA